MIFTILGIPVLFVTEFGNMQFTQGLGLTGVNLPVAIQVLPYLEFIVDRVIHGDRTVTIRIYPLQASHTLGSIGQHAIGKQFTATVDHPVKKQHAFTCGNPVRALVVTAIIPVEGSIAHTGGTDFAILVQIEYNRTEMYLGIVQSAVFGTRCQHTCLASTFFFCQTGVYQMQYTLPLCRIGFPFQ